MNDEKSKAAQPTAITRRKMLMRLGLAATAAYAAPTLLQLSEARASSFSGPSFTGPSYRRSSHSGPSFSDGRKEHRADHAEQEPRRRRRRRHASSFSFSR